jgi:hypothetical protein
MAFCIRYNPAYNTNESDGTIMYSKSKNPNKPLYKTLQPGTEIWIVGSGKKTKILMHRGVLSRKTEYLPEADELNRFKKPEEYITESPDTEITTSWDSIGKIVYPRFIGI